jgi:hypothetical protein
LNFFVTNDKVGNPSTDQLADAVELGVLPEAALRFRSAFHTGGDRLIFIGNEKVAEMLRAAARRVAD